ncbi:MAG: ATPase, T2SS/T4P/T4SS family [Bacillota bacterium]
MRWPTPAASKTQNSPEQKPIIGKKNLFQATKFIQDIITDINVWDLDTASRHSNLLEEAQAGNREAVEATQNLVMNILQDYHVEVEGYSSKDAAYEIYSYAWGLDVLEDLYWNPEIDEIRVNSPTSVFVQRRGKNQKVNLRFKDEEHIKKILSRLFVHDRGVGLNAATPVVESMRRDGTRVTATCPPATSNATLVLRKHGTFSMTDKNLIDAQTLDSKVLELLKLLVYGRVNIMISGGTGTGKTSLLRFMANYLDPRLRIITLETDREIRLGETYPDRDIVEMEEHVDLNLPMSELFRTVLRYSPDVIIVGEIRGKGEAVEAVKACTRGHNGSMATIHFGSPKEAVEGCGKMMLEEGLNLPLDIATLWVADAFQVVVQMFADTRLGIKKIIKISEICLEDGTITYHDLASWEPTSTEDYFIGQWVFPNTLSSRILKHIEKYGVQYNPLKERAVRLA